MAKPRYKLSPTQTEELLLESPLQITQKTIERLNEEDLPFNFKVDIPCHILKLYPDEQVRGVFCYSNGLPEDIGKLLLKQYQDPEKLEDLLNLGDIYQLGKQLETPPLLKPLGHLAQRSVAQDIIDFTPEQLAEINQYTIAFYRDGERDFSSISLQSKKKYIDNVADNFMLENIYLNVDGAWMYKYNGNFFGNSKVPFEDLTSVIKQRAQNR